MIHSIISSIPSFRPVYFNSGLNVIVADKAKDSTVKGSRNGLGKTTLIEIIHFCLGAELKKGSRLNVSELQNWDFTIDISIKDVRLTAKRYISMPEQISIEIIEGVSPFNLTTGDEKKENNITLKEWQNFLGKNLFNIGLEPKIKYPSCRSIMSFFVRKEDGYDNPFNIYTKEKSAATILNNAYVLGLDWETAIKLQEIQSKIDRLSNYAKISEDRGETQGVLRTQIITLKDIVEKNDADLSSFNVLPEYKNVQTEVNILTDEIQKLSNLNTIFDKKLEAYQEATTSERPTASADNLENLYKEAQIVFGENIKTQLKEAKEFHEKIIKNRQVFLETEMLSIKHTIEQNNLTIKTKANRKQELMQVLSSHGALDEYNKLQDLVLGKKAKLKTLEEKLFDLESAEKDMNKLKKEASVLKQKLKTTLTIQDQYTKDIKIFFENNNSIHDKKGNLIIDFNSKGIYTFKLDIDKGSSGGVKKVGLFCYDLMLIENAINYSHWGVDFLVHDSILYDPMDERQKANVITAAFDKSNRYNFQYIMTINSDQIPHNYFKDGFDFDKFIVVKLTDEDITKSLLGIKVSNPSAPDAFESSEQE